MINQRHATGAAVLAGLLVGGGAYAARHEVAPHAAAFASERARLEQRHAGIPHVRLLRWSPPPHRKLHAPALGAPVPATTPAPAPAVAPPPPVAASSAPSTHTSPTGSSENDHEGGSDD
jgi:hypothetical protein